MEKGIRIKVEKFLKAGEPHVRILKVDALAKSELPGNYLAHYPYVYKDGDQLVAEMGTWRYGDRTIGGASYVAAPENVFRLKDFNEVVGALNVCGKRLAAVNEEIRVKWQPWCGVETFVI